MKYIFSKYIKCNSCKKERGKEGFSSSVIDWAAPFTKLENEETKKTKQHRCFLQSHFISLHLFQGNPNYPKTLSPSHLFSLQYLEHFVDLRGLQLEFVWGYSKSPIFRRNVIDPEAILSRTFDWPLLTELLLIWLFLWKSQFSHGCLDFRCFDGV